MNIEETEIIDENSKPKDKLKAWYLFTEDFIAGTQHLTNEQLGIYIRLLCYNWNKRCSGIPCDSMTYYRIGSCLTESEKNSCDLIIEQFFIQVGEHFQNERQLQEYLFITKRIDASKRNGKLGGRPKKPSIEPRLEPSTKPPTPTPTTTPTSKQTKKTYNAYFNTFWDKVSNKVSKGIAEKNYLKLEKEWIQKPQDLAIMYNKYFNGIDDKQFAKQPAFWLSAKKYLDEKPKKENNEKIDQVAMRIKIFIDAVEKKEASEWVKKYARQNCYDVKEAVDCGYISKEDAYKYLDMEGWI